MSTAKKTDGLKTFDIDHQEASVDIWDKKYRLKDYDANPVDVENCSLVPSSPPSI